MAQQQQLVEQPQEQQWVPQFNREQTRNYIKLYNKTPGRFNEELLNRIRQHAQYHNVPFYEGDFSLLEAVKQAGAGFVEGFTTLHIADHPDNEWEAVFRSAGHLAGFAPGIMSAPLRKIGVLAGSKTLAEASRMLQGAKGLPLLAATKITKRAKPYATAIRDSSTMKRAAETNSVLKYLRGKEASDIIEGAFNLGTASAISTWQQGVDGMIDGFFSGAVAGGVFKGIGNRIAMKDPKAEMYARGLAGSLFMGLPATIRGATMPEQIYEYLMGAYFGGSEKSWKQVESVKFLQKGIKKLDKDPEWGKRFDPSEVEGFYKLEPQVQELTKTKYEQYAKQRVDQAGAGAYAILEEFGQLDRIPGETPSKKLKNLGQQVINARADRELDIKATTKKALEKSIGKKGLFVVSPGKSEMQSYIESLASKKGISVVKMMQPEDKPSVKTRPNVYEIILNKKDVKTGDRILRKAIRNVKQIEINTTGQTTLDEGKFTDYIFNALNRDARSVFRSDSVIAIDNLNMNTMKTTKGISRLPVQMGVDLKKPTYLYDKSFQRWFKYDTKTEAFKPLEVGETPELTTAPSFFGRKTLEGNEKLAIKSLFDTKEFKFKSEKLKPNKEKLLEETEEKRLSQEKAENELDTSERTSGLEGSSISAQVESKLRPHSKEFKSLDGKELKLEGRELDNKLLDVETSIVKNALNYITGTKQTKSRELIRDIEDEVDMQLPNSFKLQIRKYLAGLNQNRPKRFLKVSDSEIDIISLESPYTYGNEVRNQKQPPTAIEEYYVEKTKKPSKEPVLIELDALTHKEVDYKISNFDYVAAKVEAAQIQERFGLMRGEFSEIMEQKSKLKTKMITDAVKAMNKKGYHLYGGSGDKDKLQFIKYHPDYKKVNLVAKGFNSKTMPESIYKHAKKEYGLSKKEHDDMMRSIVAYGEALNEVPIETMAKNKGDFIQNAVNENKRAQIWMTNGLSGDKEFIKDPSQHGENLHLSKNNNFKAVMIDVEGNSKDLLNALNVKLPQGTDGAILGTTASINAMNKDAGLPPTGSNKSFLIQRNPDGTILGKYMIVAVPPKYSKMMESYKNTNPEHGAGINFLMYKSGIKQKGLKKAGDYEVKNGKLELIGNPDVFEINPSSFKYSQSVLNDNAMIGLSEVGNRAIGVTLIKQLMTSQHPDMFSSVPKEVISDMYNEIMQRAHDGDSIVNNKVMDFLNNPSPKLKKEILDNFEDIGLPTIYSALKSRTKEGRELAKDLMQKIVKIHKDSVEMLRQSGEISGVEAQEQLQEALQFTSAADKSLKLISSIEGAYPLYFDKGVKRYVNQALRRFVGQRVLTPKVKNAGVFRMRPYDKFMQIEFPEFNNDALAMKKYGVKSDEIFRLGDVARDMPLFTTIKGYEKTTLGKLWDATKGKNGPRTSNFYNKNKDKIEDVLEALSVRVPQDSPSGAQVLKFVGFTGVRNHEVLLHSRAMEAQGGADLDGDESFIYFGGRNKDGSGQGMKKEWKDMFKAQKKEFHTEDGKSIKDAKDQYRDRITLTPEIAKEQGLDPKFIQEVNSNFYAKFSPVVRAFTGRRTAQSRGQMGPVVTMTANYRQAWSSMLNSANGKDLVMKTVVDSNFFSKHISTAKLLSGNVVRKLYLVPRNKSSEQRDLTKALINFTADPANETGLIGIGEMSKLLKKAYFKEKVMFEYKGREFEDTPKNRAKYGLSGKGLNEMLKVSHEMGLNGSSKYNFNRYDLVRNINSAFFGKNRDDKRMWTNYEIQEMIQDINKYSTSEHTTAMFKFANTLKGFNFQISPFDWVNARSYRDRMSEFNQGLKDSSFPESKFKDLLSRTKIREGNSPQVDFITLNDLHIEKNQRALATAEMNNKGSIIQLLKNATKGRQQKVSPEYIAQIEKLIETKGPLNAIRKILNEAEDYFSNALHNMSTLDVIVDIYNKAEASGNKISNAEMDRLVKRADELKQDYAEKAKARNRPDVPIEPESISDLKSQTVFEKLKRNVAKRQGIRLSKKVKKDLPTLKTTRLQDLGSIDARIKKFKDSLENTYSKDMFDALIIGSLRPATPQKLQKFKQFRRKRNQLGLEKDIVQSVVKEGSRTNQSQLYLDSKEIAPKSIINFFKVKNKYFLDAYKPYKKQDFENLVKKTEKEMEIVEPNTSIVEEGNFIEKSQGFKGIKKGDLDAKQSQVTAELINNIKLYNAQNKDMNALLAGIYTRIDPENLPKSLNQMTIRDFELINNWFRFIKQGTLEQKLNRALTDLEKAKLSKMDWYEFPLTTNRKMMKFDMVFLPKQGYFRGKVGEKAKAGMVLRPTYYGEILQDTIGKVQDAAQGEAFKLSKKFTDEIQYLKQTNVAEDGNAIWRMAVRKLELPQGYNMEPANNIYDKLFKESKINNNWKEIKDKQYIVDFGKGKERTKVKGSDLIDITMNKIDSFFKGIHPIIAGKDITLKDGTKAKAWEKYRRGWYDEAETQPILNYKEFIKDVTKSMAKGEEFTMDLGIDGMRHMARAMTIDLIPASEYIGTGKHNFEKIMSAKKYFKLSRKEQKDWRPHKEIIAEAYKDVIIENTGERKGYFPHYYPETSKIKKMRDNELDILMKDTKMTRQEKESKLAEIMFKYKTRTGDWDYGDYADWAQMRDTILPGAIKQVEQKVSQAREKTKIKTIVPKMANQFKRENHIGGWDIDPVNVQTYVNNVTNTYFRQLGNILNTVTLHTMKQRLSKKWVKGTEAQKEDGRKLANGWVQFWKQYVSEAMGNPTIVSKELYNDPNMKIQGTLYGAFADNLMAKKVNKLREKLKTRKDAKIEKYFADYSETTGKDAYDMRRWSQVEAQWELATLMTHPKTPINNVFGGTLHTASSASFTNLRKARDIEYLQRINPKWTSRQKVTDFMEEIGVGPELLAHEYGLNKQFKEGAALEFTRELAKKFGGSKDASLKDVLSLKNKHGVSRKIMDKAVLFMSKPEKALRRDSFMAHYIKAWERLNGAVTNPYDPILIEIGKQGVKATQFLYSSAYRMPFARSGLGKIMSRFQLWSWNAIRFRKDLFHDAKIYGFDKNSDAVNKFKRTMAIDSFVFALSSIFMYSLFDQILPAPWNYLQDTAQWMFGDEKERERAFFGTYPTAIAPLAMVTPPIARLPISVIREFADDDYNKLADYYIWTMFPFGRMLKDVAHPEQSIFNNPMRIPEKVFGFPMTGLAKEAKRIKESTEKTPTPGLKQTSY